MAVNTLAKFRTDMASASAQNYLKGLLKDKAPEFITSMTSLVSGNPSLQECTTKSLMNTALKATSLNLPLDSNLGFAYAIAYDNSKKEKRNGKWEIVDKVMEAQFQIGYKGFVQLAIRSGQFKTINVRDVRQGEIIGEDFISGMLQFRSLPAAERNNAEVIGYVAFFELSNGFQKMLYMSNEDLKAHGKNFSSSYKLDVENAKKYKDYKGRSLWETNFDAMAKKTTLKLLISKYAPLSVQMVDAIKSDQAVLGDNGQIDYPDNEKHDVEEVVEQEVEECAGKTEIPDEEETQSQEEVPPLFK